MVQQEQEELVEVVAEEVLFAGCGRWRLELCQGGSLRKRLRYSMPSLLAVSLNSKAQ